MKYLVTGCGGFIGSAICSNLLQKGHQVLGVDRLDDLLYPSKTKIERISKLEHQNFIFLHCDIVSKEFYVQVMNFAPQIFINEAGLPGQVLSWTALDSYSQSNFLGAYKLGQIAQELEVSVFLQASTSSVYGLNACGNEMLTKNPASPYGVTKLAAEHVLSALLSQSKTKIVFVRYFSVYGPGQRPDMGIYKFIQAAITEKPVLIYGDGEQSRDFTFIDDAVEGTLAAVKYGENLEAYNISGGNVITVNEVLDAIEVFLNKKIVRTYVDVPKGDQYKTFADTTKAQNHLKWGPKATFHESLSKQIEWQQSKFST